MSEMEQLAKEALQTAVRDSHDAAFAAGLAYPFIDAKYSERRQKLAQEAQAAANDAYLHFICSRPRKASISVTTMP
jgi:hypothetical protein